MSALVGYRSSSDEEDSSDAAPPQVLNAGSPSDAAHSVHHPNVLAITDAEPDATASGPYLGPSAHANGNQVVDATHKAPPKDPQDLSERDAIRYLTQTTHPMTSMPPSPPGSPDPNANARFMRFLELKTKGAHFNEDLAKKAPFRNPSLLSTMLTRAGIDENSQYSTSLPLGLWNPTGLPLAGYKEELLKSQQEIRGKEEANMRLLSAAGKRSIEFASASMSASSSRDSTPGQHNKRRRP